MTAFDFVGPGMTGPKVAGLRALLKLPSGDEYDEIVTARVRGYQVMHQHTLTDGIVDKELLALLPWDVVSLDDLERYAPRRT